jgi:hypothetical protein
MLGSAKPNPEHTAWFCKDTIQELLSRFGWKIKEVKYGSRNYLDNHLPIPSSIKHDSMHICAEAL